MQQLIWEWILYIVLIVVPTLIALKELPKRLKSLRQGYRGFLYSPLAFVIGIFVLIFMTELSKVIPLLNCSLLGYNIVSLGIPKKDSNVMNYILLPFSILVMVIFNYWEEELFRESYRQVLLWAAIHFLMGPPIYAIVPIFCEGLLYKHVYDKYSVNHSYAAHLGTNIMIVMLSVVMSYV